jgi:hypothetical protein
MEADQCTPHRAFANNARFIQHNLLITLEGLLKKGLKYKGRSALSLLEYEYLFGFFAVN